MCEAPAQGQQSGAKSQLRLAALSLVLCRPATKAKYVDSKGKAAARVMSIWGAEHALHSILPHAWCCAAATALGFYSALHASANWHHLAWPVVFEKRLQCTGARTNFVIPDPRAFL